MKLMQAGPHSWYLPFGIETDRPALGCVCGSRLTLLVDAGNSPAHLQLMQEAMAGMRQPDLIALTHSHWDHTFGLCASSAPAICCRQTQEQLQRMAGWTWTLPAMEERLRTR